MFDDLKDDKKQKMNSIQHVEKKICSVEDKVIKMDEKISVMFWMRNVPQRLRHLNFLPGCWCCLEKLWEGAASLEEVHHQGQALRFYSFALLPDCSMCFLFVFEYMITQLPASFARCNAIPAIIDLSSEIITQNKLFFHLEENCSSLRIQWHTKK